MGNRYSNIIDFTLIYNRYKKQLYNYVCKMLGDKYIAEDIIQNVFLKFYENLKKIKNVNTPQAWLFTTARNEVYSHLRKKKIKSENYIDDDFEYSSNESLQWDIEENEIKEILENEIGSLPDELKEVIVLRDYSELSYKEISEILKMEESLVKGRIFRARQKIIDKISKIAR